MRKRNVINDAGFGHYWRIRKKKEIAIANTGEVAWYNWVRVIATGRDLNFVGTYFYAVQRET